MGERKTVDARGAYCPGPLMELIATLKLVDIGDEIEVLSSDGRESFTWVSIFPQ